MVLLRNHVDLGSSPFLPKLPSSSGERSDVGRTQCKKSWGSCAGPVWGSTRSQGHPGTPVSSTDLSFISWLLNASIHCPRHELLGNVGTFDLQTTGTNDKIDDLLRPLTEKCIRVLPGPCARALLGGGPPYPSLSQRSVLTRREAEDKPVASGTCRFDKLLACHRIVAVPLTTLRPPLGFLPQEPTG